LIAAAIRRYVVSPEGLQRTWDASLILILIGGLMVTFLLTEAGSRGEGHQVWLPAGATLANALTAIGLDQTALTSVGQAAWWVHVLILLGFLVYLPYSKHMHLLWAPAAVFFAEVPAKGTLPPADPEDDGRQSALGQFTWRMLLGAYSCAECGRCERVCPAHASGAKLSPRDVVHEFKAFVLEQGFASLGHKRGNGRHTSQQPSVSATELWGCTTCHACMDRCPVRNEHVPLIVHLRRKLVEHGELDGGLQEALSSLQRYGNSLGKPPRKRFAWADGLATPLKDAEKEPVQYLWFVGDYAAYHPASAAVSKAIALSLQAAGVDFGVLKRGERGTGNDVRRVGEEGLFELLAEQNMKALGKARFDRIVTTDPHTYHTLKHEYPKFGLDTSIVHYSELLDDCLADRTLTVNRPLQGRAVFHDPCYLGRINGIYDPPRRVIEAVGLQITEMERSRENSFCCGAGGGKIWMDEEPGITERPANLRVREALEIDDVSHFVVACPKDLTMFQDAVKTLDAEDRLRVVDLGELVFEATGLSAQTETEP
jgi:Fe-S oxidoreductase